MSGMKDNHNALGALHAISRPTKRATRDDIIWAAGIYEGEGSTYRTVSTEKVTVNQKGRWLPDRLRALFGGSVYGPYDATNKRATGSNMYRWQISGARARGFLMSIYGLLSPRRQLQASIAMNWDGHEGTRVSEKVG